MKLQTCQVFIVGNPPPSFGGAYFIFVKLTTDCGVVGYGECYAASVAPSVMKAVIEDVFARYFADNNPCHLEKLFRLVYSSGFTQRPDLTVMGAFSGLEIACWDILGKHRDTPIYDLLGGRLHARLRYYSYLYPPPTATPAQVRAFYHCPDQSAECAHVLVTENGLTAIKFDPAGPYTIFGGHQPRQQDTTLSVQFCARLREAVGDKADLLFGTHGQFTPAGAIRLAKLLEPFDPLWFEEPVPPDNATAMAQVARQTSIPIASGERLCTKSEFIPLLQQQAVAVVQPALGRVGGLWEAKKLSVLAECFGVQVAPHLYAGPIAWLANIHLAATLPNLLMVETIGMGNDFHRQLLTAPITMADGYITPPTAPGLGAELNESVATAHPYHGDKLHLQMQESPATP